MLTIVALAVTINLRYLPLQLYKGKARESFYYASEGTLGIVLSCYGNAF